MTDRTELKESKKWGTLNVINNLFKIYFELNNLRLCQNLIRAVEGPGFPKALDGQTVEGRSFTVPQHGQSAPLAGPQLASCASSGCAWRLWAGVHSQGERPAHWAPSHCLGCLS